MNAQNLALIASHFIQARWRWQHVRGPALQHYQDRRAQRMVAYVAQHSPFYRQHWSGYDLQNWRHLPLVDKQLMMSNFTEFNTRGIVGNEAMRVALEAERTRNFQPMVGGLTVGLSSGTSGHRGLFLASAYEQAGWAGTILARALHSLRPRRLRVAFFLRSNSNLYEQVGGLLLQFRYFDLMQPLPAVIAALNTFRPDIIVGPPSLLGFLADARTQGKLQCQPERLISVAEVLETQQQAHLEEVFQAPVHQIYQCTEGLLAVSCARGSLHIQEDIVALQFEPLAAADKDSGQPERVVPIVTDLWRRTQPIIRYRLNDVLQLESALCPCGSSFRVIRSIEGRCDDICYFIGLDGEIRPFFPDTIRRMILLASSEITDYRVVQEYPGQLSIRLVVAPESFFASIAARVRESVEQTLAQYACKPATIVLIEGIEPLAPGVKLRRVRCLENGTH